MSLVLFMASLAALDAERRAPNSPIKNFGDALWWSATTVTTIGYGDRYPVTAGGRLVAVGLMLAGIVLLGTVTASLATWFLNKVREVEAQEQGATRRDVESLALEVRLLREQLALRDQLSAGDELAGRPASRDHPVFERAP